MIFVKRQYFVDAITKACKVATDDDTRYYANGVYFDAQEGSLRLVASDAIHLYSASIPCHVDKVDSVLVRRKELSKMLRVIKSQPSEYVEIEIDSDTLSCKMDEYSFPCIAGQYPPYEQAIPTCSNFGGRVFTKDWLDSLKVLSTVVDKNNIFRLMGDIGSGFTPGICEADVPLPWIGDVPSAFNQGTSINYNISLLKTILSCCGEKANLDWEKDVRPVKITPVTARFPEFFLLVPARF